MNMVMARGAENVLASGDDVVSGSHPLVDLAVGQVRILELIATGSPLRQTLDALLVFLEQDLPEMLCSILLLDGDGACLRHGSAPSLPEAYLRAIDGCPIGPRAGSCGTAAYLGEPVVVADIASDPLWTDYRDLARQHGLQACWSTPILGPEGGVLGTFAMYFRAPRTPSAEHHRVIEIATHIAAIAISKDLREKAAREGAERYRLLNLATNDAVWDWDVRKNTLWWNDGVERLFGYAASEVTSDFSWWVERVHPEDRDRVDESLRATAASGASSWSEDYRFLRRDGEYADIQDRGYVMRDATGATVRMIGTMQDISERKEAQHRIESLAYYEPVTGLRNRTAMQRELAEAVANVTADRPELVLLLLNLNYFRDINDSLGHQNGDLLLRQVAGRFRAAVGDSGRVACLGGDEFAVLLHRTTEPLDVEGALATVHDCLQEPVEVAGIPIKVETTVGTAVCPRDGETAELLWQHADVALRTAKERHERHLHYHPGINQYDPTRLALISELRVALTEDQLVLHYQPKLDLKSGRTVAVEALVRWKHPTRGMTFPDTFIPLAERTGLINPLTTWVVTAALRQGLELAQAGLPLDVSVNLSARNLHEPGFSQELLRLIDAIGFPLSRLTLEITETAIMADPARAKTVLGQLHDAGIHLSMDDFGIGQSSLTYLKDLPITKMKIDKSFVMGFDQPRNVCIVRSAIDLGRNMGLNVTAEGIEDEATYHALRDLGCDLGQGYFFSKPLGIEPLTSWLRESRWGVTGETSV
jgi:diguanylate cyclase (GGDEF)-like protein/PAS domain S-box-containing protein